MRIATAIRPGRTERKMVPTVSSTPASQLLNPALTMSLLGLISEDAVIRPRTGKLGTKRRRADDSPTEDNGSERDTAAAEPKTAAV